MQKDFDKLLSPYKEGGTEDSPVERTMGTIITKLMLSYRHPPEIVGAAIYKVFSQMAQNGLEFSGDGTYGSKGRDLFSCINAQCIDLTQRKVVEETLDKIRNITSCTRSNCKQRSTLLEKQTKWKRMQWFFIQPRGTLKLISICSGVYLFGGLSIWLYIMGLTPLQLFLLEFFQRLMDLLTIVT